VQLTAEERTAYRLGRRSFERGDDEIALDQLTRLAAARPRFADVHYMLGVVHERRGELDAAAACLQRALRINPDYAEARLALASVFEQRGEYERSRELNRTARTDAPSARVDPTTRAKLANLQAALGDAYREAGELGDAVESYRKALDRCPRFHDIRCRLGATLRDAGLPQQAITELERVVRANPDYLDARVQLGLTYFSLGQWTLAAEQWEAAIARDPGREDARMYLRMGRSPGEPSIQRPTASSPGEDI
jgi:tetratricopeptide (TPR) repeat protein